jgi:hypothetical protein
MPLKSPTTRTLAKFGASSDGSAVPLVSAARYREVSKNCFVLSYLAGLVQQYYEGRVGLCLHNNLDRDWEESGRTRSQLRLRVFAEEPKPNFAFVV